MIEFFCSGTPKGQPRPKAFARRFGDKWMARVYDSGTAEFWKSQIAVAGKPVTPARPLSGPVSVGLEFFFQRPKAQFGTGKKASELKPNAPEFCSTKPDADNAAKAVLDALTCLGFWVDDAQVCNLRITKRYANPPGQMTGCAITIRAD